MASMQKRLQKELLALQNDPPPGMTLNEKSVQNSITQWIVDMEGAPGTLYEGEKFQLLFKFSSRYPFDSPQVMFTGDNIPVHPHVYSNGHICLSILTEDWSPALSVQSVCLSIISMLSSCKEKRRPPDNSFYVRTCNKNPKKTKWWYHGPLQILEGCYEVSPEPSLLQAEEPQLSQPVFIGEVLQPFDHHRGPPLDSFQQLHVLLMLGAPEMNAVLQVGSHESRVKGQNHLPRRAGRASFDAAQDMVGFLGCERTLPAHVELLILLSFSCPTLALT
ncbi:ubiquitin-conjugating enzyme E2 W isoform X1 [Nyctibius grandis]|uniref:ubiquitin-conjugating enzyme E2 W isoform X1 n=1 Tax=Nyctibius grandis TaxID=48427 RepID=UPI0035BBAD8B